MNGDEIPIKTRKKLIEVALPLESINTASAAEKLIKVGKPTNLHLWWARRPLASARAVIFGQMVDDPSGHPEEFPTGEEQEKERQRLFRLLEQLVLWENTNNGNVLQQARDEIWKSWRVACIDNKDHPRAAELFDSEKLPAFYDPFAGGGVLPLEAQRLGLESHASDLNPVAVLINKAMIEIPQKFTGQQPVNPDANKNSSLFKDEWIRAQGLLEDVNYYGQWIRDEAEKRIGHLYPKVEVTAEMVRERPDLGKYAEKKLTVIAWLWARTVKSPNPAFSHVDVPLISNYMLSVKKGKEAYIEPAIKGEDYRFTVKMGEPKDIVTAKNGTKLGGRGSPFLCIMSGTPIPFKYIQSEAKANRMGARLMAIVAEGNRERAYLTPTSEMEAIAQTAQPYDVPETELPAAALGFRVQGYGMTKWRDLFTPRQLIALTTFADLIPEARELVRHDARALGMGDDQIGLGSGGVSATAYGDAVGVYLSLALSRAADWNNSLSAWENKAQVPQQLFRQHSVPMVWDYSESNIFSESTGSYMSSIKNLIGAFSRNPVGTGGVGFAMQLDAAVQAESNNRVVSTDPPYYDNIGYADLSDFFYIWLRRVNKSVFPDLFTTLLVPKAEELIASSHRQGSTKKAQSFFINRMTLALKSLIDQAHPYFPVTIYYAFKQSETKEGLDGGGTGWETFLQALIDSGFSIVGTWPIRSESRSRLSALDRNVLASSILLVCRPQSGNATTATRTQFIAALRAGLPQAVKVMQESSIAPVDLVQAVIGPGVAIFTRYASVLDISGEPLSVGDALAIINQILNEVLNAQEGDLDSDSRWALAWFDEVGFNDGEYGQAEQLALSMNTSIAGLVDAGVLISGRGKVRLFRPNELPEDWDPVTDARTPVWESVHHLVRVLESGGETAAGVLVSKLHPGTLEATRDLVYWLHNICERKNRTAEALSYNALAQSWTAIVALSMPDSSPQQGTLM